MIRMGKALLIALGCGCAAPGVVQTNACEDAHVHELACAGTSSIALDGCDWDMAVTVLNTPCEQLAARGPSGPTEPAPSNPTPSDPSQPSAPDPMEPAPMQPSPPPMEPEPPAMPPPTGSVDGAAMLASSLSGAWTGAGVAETTLVGPQMMDATITFAPTADPMQIDVTIEVSNALGTFMTTGPATLDSGPDSQSLSVVFEGGMDLEGTFSGTLTFSGSDTFQLTMADVDGSTIVSEIALTMQRA